MLSDVRVRRQRKRSGSTDLVFLSCANTCGSSPAEYTRRFSAVRRRSDLRTNDSTAAYEGRPFCWTWCHKSFVPCSASGGEIEGARSLCMTSARQKEVAGAVAACESGADACSLNAAMPWCGERTSFNCWSRHGDSCRPAATHIVGGYPSRYAGKTIEPDRIRGFEPAYLDSRKLTWSAHTTSMTGIAIAIRTMLYLAQHITDPSRCGPPRVARARCGFQSVIKLPDE